jgi:hypothetical protein
LQTVPPDVHAFPRAAGTVAQFWATQTAVSHVAGAGQSVAVTHATHEPEPLQTWPFPSAHVAPDAAGVVEQAPAGLHTAVAQTGDGGQSDAARQLTQEPEALQ